LLAPQNLKFSLDFRAISEKRSADEVFRLPAGCAPQLHSLREREEHPGLQADLPGRGHPAVPGADHHPPPLGAPQAGEGQVQAVRQGRLDPHTKHTFILFFLSFSYFNFFF